MRTDPNSLHNLTSLLFPKKALDANSWSYHLQTNDSPNGITCDSIIVTSYDNSVYFLDAHKYGDNDFHMILHPIDTLQILDN